MPAASSAGMNRNPEADHKAPQSQDLQGKLFFDCTTASVWKPSLDSAMLVSKVST